MQNPFPGMNPYLEQSLLWHQVHNRLIVAIADSLTPQIAPKYRVSIEERVYTSVEEALVVGVADVSVARRSTEPSRHPTSTIVTEPMRVQIPLPEVVVERFLEVRSTQTQAVICAIEILSPKNKRSGEGRATYESKRQKILVSATHLVEIDLLRSGQPMPVSAAADVPYRILVSRSQSRPEADLYLLKLREPIPVFPIPLQPGEPEPSIDLQQLLNDVYDRARFDLAIDYAQPLKPSLSAEDTAWLALQLS